MSATYSVTIKNADKLEKALQKYPSIANKFIGQALTASAAVLSKNTRVGVVPYKTGRLLQSFFFSKPNSHSVAWAPNTKYAFFVHEGTSKMPARPFLKTIREDSQEEIDRLFDKATDGIVKEIAKQSS